MTIIDKKERYVTQLTDIVFVMIGFQRFRKCVYLSKNVSSNRKDISSEKRPFHHKRKKMKNEIKRLKANREVM